LMKSSKLPIMISPRDLILGGGNVFAPYILILSLMSAGTPEIPVSALVFKPARIPSIPPHSS
jgi:hypothetical protein